ncbi:hypothetical protein ISS04_04665 [Candidatus Woesearchaeota archaeon]|nr:hypothetical protein [Candidatus Woesearchaeota archaeon]
MSNQTQTLEDITTNIVLNVPVCMHKKRHKSLAAAGGSPSDYEERFTEYLMPDKRWTPDNVRMKFRGQVQQHHTEEQYANLLSQRQEHKSAYGRISIELTPLTNVQRDGVNSSIDGQIQTITLDVPIHLNHDETHFIAAAGNKNDGNRYSVQFLVHDTYQRSMPQNVRGILPSFVDLFVSEEQYSQLVEQRKEQRDAYGRIVIKLEPLAKQG